MVVFRTFGGCSSAGRALQSHCRGQGFDPPQLHGVIQRRHDFLPLGVTGNTPDSGSGESWFEPRRGNSKARCYFGGVEPSVVTATATDLAQWSGASLRRSRSLYSIEFTLTTVQPAAGRRRVQEDRILSHW